MIEIWKDIKGHEGLYQVSNLGRFKSMKFDKILKVTFRKKLSHVAIICLKSLNGKYITKNARRIIGETFIENLYNLKHVFYKDDKLNLNIENLYWTSSQHHTLKTTSINIHNCALVKCKKTVHC